MSHQRLQGVEIDATHCRTRGERVTEIVKVKVVNAGAAKGRVPESLEVVDESASRRCEHKTASVLAACLQLHDLRG
jgi:hypothetical protein